MLDLQAEQINLTTTLSERPTDSLSHSQQETYPPEDERLSQVTQMLTQGEYTTLTLTASVFSCWSLRYFEVICKWCKKDPNQALEVSIFGVSLTKFSD